MNVMTVGSVLLFPLLGALVHADDQKPSGGELTLTVLFDNQTEEAGLHTGWGFAVLVETPEHTVLFDTGADGPTLLENMRALGKDPARVGAIVISHAHADHTNGMEALLETGVRPRLYVLDAFPAEATEAFSGPLDAIAASPGQEIVPGVRTTGAVGTAIPEQALILDTSDGPIVLTGCAHPGPLEMVARTAELSDRPVFGLMGGLHLFQTPDEEVARIIERLQARGVVKAGATHCSGPQAIVAFQEAYAADYVPMGVGRAIRLPLA